MCQGSIDVIIRLDRMIQGWAQALRPYIKSPKYGGLTGGGESILQSRISEIETKEKAPYKRGCFFT